MSTNILPLPAPEMGVCAVCDGEFKVGQTTAVHPVETKLVFRDRTTGLKVGLCCVEALRTADDFLHRHGPKAGVVHPEPPTQY